MANIRSDPNQTTDDRRKQDGRITVGIKEAEAAIEAILFAMGDSVELEKIAKAIDQDTATTRKIIEGMMDHYRAKNRGIQIVELDGAFQLCTKSSLYEYLIRVAKQPKKITLSDVVMETLSIIAYKQPIRSWRLRRSVVSNVITR